MKKVKALIFDLGRTLINYDGIPLYWGDHYEIVFNKLNLLYKLNLSVEQINNAINSMMSFNTSLFPREIEYSSDYIFSNDLTLSIKVGFYTGKRIRMSLMINY